MTHIARLPLLVLLAATSLPASATDFSAAGILFFGIPGLLLANGLLAAGFAFAPGRAQKVAAVLVFVPVLAFGAFIASNVAGSLSHDGFGWAVGGVYVALYGLLVFLLVKLCRRAPERR